MDPFKGSVPIPKTNFGVLVCGSCRLSGRFVKGPLRVPFEVPLLTWHSGLRDCRF